MIFQTRANKPQGSLKEFLKASAICQKDPLSLLVGPKSPGHQEESLRRQEREQDQQLPEGTLKPMKEQLPRSQEGQRRESQLEEPQLEELQLKERQLAEPQLEGLQPEERQEPPQQRECL